MADKMRASIYFAKIGKLLDVSKGGIKYSAMRFDMFLLYKDGDGDEYKLYFIVVRKEIRTKTHKTVSYEFSPGPGYSSFDIEMCEIFGPQAAIGKLKDFIRKAVEAKIEGLKNHK